MADYVWTGDTSGSLETLANFLVGAVVPEALPGAGDTLTIPAVAVGKADPASGACAAGTIHVTTGKIDGGTFAGDVENDGTINGGTFNGDVVNDDGTIGNGAIFNAGLTFDGTNWLVATALLPDEADVRSAVTYGHDPLTGTAVIPDPADVRFGEDVDATTGTCYVPTAAQTLYGVDVDATTGTVTLPNTDGSTPDASLVSATAHFGAANATSGTLDLTDLAEGNIKEGVTIGGILGTFTHTIDYIPIINVVDESFVLTGHDNYMGGDAGTLTLPAVGKVDTTAGDYGVGGSGSTPTLDLAAAEAAAAAAQLVDDKAAIDAAKAGILATVTILTIQGTLAAAKVLTTGGGTYQAVAITDVRAGVAVGVSPAVGTLAASVYFAAAGSGAGDLRLDTVIGDVTGTLAVTGSSGGGGLTVG